MTLVKYRNPQRSIESIFDDFFGPSFMKPFIERSEFGNSFPSANIMEEENSYKIELAVPGIEKDNLNIDLDDNLLRISAESKVEKNDEKFKVREFNYQSFRRSFKLPKEIDAEKIGAKYADGILSIEIPKLHVNENDKKKSITIS